MSLNRTLKEFLIEKSTVRGHLAVEPYSCLGRFLFTIVQGFVYEVLLEQRFAAEKAEARARSFRERKIAGFIEHIFAHVFGAFLADAVAAVHVAIICKVKCKVHNLSSVNIIRNYSVRDQGLYSLCCSFFRHHSHVAG